MAERFEFFGGVDFSGGKEPVSNLWSAVGVPCGDRLHVVDLRPHAFREDLLHFLCHGAARNGWGQRGVWGLDFPFSLPSEAARGMMGVDEPVDWQRQVEWLAFQQATDLEGMGEPYRQAMRAIDPAGAMAALNVRLLKQTLAGARLLAELVREDGMAVCPQMDADEARCVFVEVYPSATAKDLSLSGRKPTRPGQARARPEMLSSWLSFQHPSLEATAATLEDAWDATLACLTAWLVREDLDQPGRAGVCEELVRREGWIYRHPQAVGG